jgi:hypothetical protein
MEKLGVDDPADVHPDALHIHRLKYASTYPPE